MKGTIDFHLSTQPRKCRNPAYLEVSAAGAIFFFQFFSSKPPLLFLYLIVGVVGITSYIVRQTMYHLQSYREKLKLKPVSHQPCGSRAPTCDDKFLRFVRQPQGVVYYIARLPYDKQGRKAAETSKPKFSTCPFSLGFVCVF